MNILDIIGLKVVAIKGIPEHLGTKKQTKKVPVRYIFFDDGETFIELDEQDYYTYHDCSGHAREINIRKNKNAYDNLMKVYPDSTYGEWY